MKAEAGWGAAALVAAAALVGVGSHSPDKADSAAAPRAGAQSRAAPNATATSPFESGPCVELESHIQTFLLTSPESIVAPDSCFDATDKADRARAIDAAHLAGSELQERAAGLQFVIAILPDPLHTHLSLSFDRQTEAIQQAAQDEGYLYDSSWMPWETEKPSLALLDDQDKLDDRTKAREDQPGLMLFRHGPKLGGKKPVDNNPILYNPVHYQFGLVVFVVGEEATSGIHKRQFENAVRWIDALHPQALNSQVQILGPSFSGSLLSLSQLMMHDQSLTSIGWLHSLNGGSPLELYSGGISSESAVNWFVGNSPAGIKFRSFQESDDVLLSRYRKYLINQGFEISRLALVSEDETAFGGLDRSPNDKGDVREEPCVPQEGEGHVGPLCVYYPRDISALRAAYQKQSIFNTGTTPGVADATRRALSDDLADPEHDQHDTVRNYSGNQTPLSQEAVLQQIVSVLKAHKSEYVVLRSSNPLDQLFLSHFLRLAYPEARVVIEGSDLLLRRESGAAALSGIMTLTTYPLLPWENHWIRPYGQSLPKSFQTAATQPQWHIHRVFAQETAEGTYMAARFLLSPKAADVGCNDPAADAQRKNRTYGNKEYFLPPNCADLSLHDYAPPFWAMPTSNGTLPEESVRPATWLSVLGKDGYWPVAALNDETLRSFRGQRELSSSSDPVVNQAHSWWSREAMGAETSLGSLVVGVEDLWPGMDSSLPVGNGMDWPPMPASMKICLFALLVLTGFHLHCSALPSLTAKPGHRAYFVRTGELSHAALMVLGSVFLAMTPVILGWGYGAMSTSGEPLPHDWAWWYRVFPPLIWLMAGAAVGVNAWVESELNPQPNAPVEGTGVRVWLANNREIWGPVVWYAGATFAFYCLIDTFLNATLNDANRIPTYWRAIHLTTGVSPLVPLIALPCGLYLWFWYSLQGLALFNADRPLLPKKDDLAIYAPPVSLPQEDARSWFDGLLAKFGAADASAPRPEGPVNRLLTLRMLSQEEAGQPIEELSRPFSKETLWVAAVLFPVLLIGSFMLAGDVPIRSLGSKDYSLFFAAGLDACVSLILANAWQLLRVWLRLRQLLVFLDRLHLRLTLKALKGYSWGSVWGMGGRVLDVRYKLVSRQIESLTHLSNSLKECKDKEAANWCEQIDNAQILRSSFAHWFSENWDNWKERDLQPFQQLQESFAAIAGVMLGQLLMPAWRLDEKSLVLDFSSDKSKDDKPPASELPPDYILNAEEFVCLVFMAFIQNVLGRMRTIVMQILLLFVAATVSIATYPFDPRPALSGAMMLLFAILGTVVVIVYSQMHRDATLSYVTDTEPGELGPEFWFKVIGFGLGPVLGLLATIFPQLPGSLFSWLQPGISSLK